jgi:hypothetical protein
VAEGAPWNVTKALQLKRVESPALSADESNRMLIAEPSEVKIAETISGGFGSTLLSSTERRAPLENVALNSLEELPVTTALTRYVPAALAISEKESNWVDR